jgi:branched-subunit amino acid aminotransferase/4-amino-4-deoxychorismate lyase
MDFILHNGKIIRSDDLQAGSHCRENGPTFTQGMWFANGEIPHFQLLYDEFLTLLHTLGRPALPGFPPEEELLRLIKRLINKNKAFMGGWVDLRLTFQEEGMETVVRVRPYPDRLFPLDGEGKTGILSPFVKSSGNPLSRYFFFSETLWKTERFRSGGKAGEVSIYLNEQGKLTEATGGNLFCILKDQLFTPSTETGCVRDILRDPVIRSAKVLGFRVTESDKLVPEDLDEMEEIFVVSEGEGFRWIRGIGRKRYFRSSIELIRKQVNKGFFAPVS